jgi:hypothetical protein
MSKVVFSKYTKEAISQNGGVMHRDMDVRFRDFELRDERSQLAVEIGEKSNFLARNVYKKTNYESHGMLATIWHIIIDILNACLLLNISYEAGQR